MQETVTTRFLVCDRCGQRTNMDTPKNARLWGARVKVSYYAGASNERYYQEPEWDVLPTKDLCVPCSKGLAEFLIGDLGEKGR